MDVYHNARFDASAPQERKYVQSTFSAYFLREEHSLQESAYSLLTVRTVCYAFTQESAFRSFAPPKTAQYSSWRLLLRRRAGRSDASPPQLDSPPSQLDSPLQQLDGPLPPLLSSHRRQPSTLSDRSA